MGLCDFWKELYSVSTPLYVIGLNDQNVASYGLRCRQRPCSLHLVLAGFSSQHPSWTWLPLFTHVEISSLLSLYHCFKFASWRSKLLGLCSWFIRLTSTAKKRATDKFRLKEINGPFEIAYSIKEPSAYFKRFMNREERNFAVVTLECYASNLVSFGLWTG